MCITSLNSYYLSKGLGKVGTVSGIEQVIVDGIALPLPDIWISD